jgi:hypothetical protein
MANKVCKAYLKQSELNFPYSETSAYMADKRHGDVYTVVKSVIGIIFKFDIGAFSGFCGWAASKATKAGNDLKKSQRHKWNLGREVLQRRCREKASAFGRGRPGKTLVGRSYTWELTKSSIELRLSGSFSGACSQ